MIAAFNNLNQLTSRDWSGMLDVHGRVANTSIVVVVGGVTSAPPYFNGTNWLGGVAVGAGSNVVTVAARLGTNNLGTNFAVHMPPVKPQTFLYDLNGSLTNDGWCAYYWDEENRLAAIETIPDTVPDVNRRYSEYLYDATGRRIVKADLSGWDGTGYAITNITRSVWDGWNLLAELDADGNLVAYNAWGLDLSQSLQGAGGIGGLLVVVRVDTQDVWQYHYDANGNVVDVLDLTGAEVAHYEYDPFGRITVQTGVYAAQNPWRFATRQTDDPWNLRYCGRRYFSSGAECWLSRDPADSPESQFLAQAPRPMYGNPISGPDGPVGPANPYDPNPWEPPKESPLGCVAKCVLSHILGIEVDTIVVISGQPVLRKRFVMVGSAEGTSIVGKLTDLVLEDAEFPRGMPTLTRCCKLTFTKSISRFVSRWVPYVGWALLTYDVAGLAGCICGCEE